MKEFRLERKRSFTAMCNVHLRDKNLSLKAKGLLSMMVGLPEEWDYSVNGLTAIVKEGRNTVLNTLKELEEHGYLYREQARDENGRMKKITYVIYEIPDENPHFSPRFKKPTAVKPTSEKPHADFERQLNTKELNTKQLITYSPAEQEDEITEIIEFFNATVGTSYRTDTKTTRVMIQKKLEKFSKDDCKKVISTMYREWNGTEYARGLQPATLFGKKFETYLNWQGSGSRTKKNKFHNGMQSDLDMDALEKALIGGK